MNGEPKIAVRYSKGGHWVPSIPGQSCQLCGAEYTASRKGQAFCSKSCAQRARAAKIAAETHTERTCPSCLKVWRGPPSNKSRYCSKDCMVRGMGWEEAIKLDCAGCGTLFFSRRRKSRGTWERYCSRECASAPKLERVSRPCANCGEEFKTLPKRAHEVTCSAACRREYFIRDRSHAWTGGEVLQHDRPYRRIDREGYAAKYEGEHRLIAGREIGRQLRRGEVVLVIDGNKENLDPANLFICPTFAEHGMIRVGTVDWPTKSNLQEYKLSGYVRPPVKLVVHEWEDGRRPGKGGKWITRHPQADEIIKRRKAGATLAQLSEAFDTPKSNMASILKNRL